MCVEASVRIVANYYSKPLIYRK